MAMIVETVPPSLNCAGLLQGTTYADAFSMQTGEAGLDAITATERIMARMPRWITGLLMVRNAIVAPLGLRGAGPRQNSQSFMGPFPVVSQTPERVVLGFNDRHLDFRLVVDVPGSGEIIGTTLIRTHNWLGRVYLAIVLPFHRIIVPAMMRNAAGQ